MLRVFIAILAAVSSTTALTGGRDAAPPFSSAGSQAVPAVPGLESRLREVIARSGAEVAVLVHPLDAPRPLLAIDGTMRFHAASTMKVPIMVELYRQASLGRLSLDDTMVVTNRFTSIADGSAYALSVGDDSDAEIYKAAGRPLPLRVLCDAMITVSSNLATNLLIEKLGARAVQATVDAMGAGGMQVLRGVEDQKAFDLGLNNTTDAVGLGRILWLIGRGEAVSPEASAAMVDILARQRFRGGTPAGLPAGMKVAHKTGSITRIRHDAGIVYGPRPYVLVVLVRGIQDSKASDALIAEISRLVWSSGVIAP